MLKQTNDREEEFIVNDPKPKVGKSQAPFKRSNRNSPLAN